MGRAIVRSPKAFLFDEPLANLDAALRAELRIEIASIVRRLGTTSLYVTHDQVEAMTMGDRIAVLRAGTLQQLGPPRAIYETPANVFVAGFLGSPPMNLFDLELDDGALCRPGIAIPPPPGIALPARITAGIRPEQFVVGRDAPGQIVIEGTVVAAEPLGAETYLYVDVPSSTSDQPVRMRARTHGFDTPPHGDKVRLAVDPASVHWFDAATGKRLAIPCHDV
jgi:multiple sugar transport system ATP-binding protein